MRGDTKGSTIPAGTLGVRYECYEALGLQVLRMLMQVPVLRCAIAALQ